MVIPPAGYYRAGANPPQTIATTNQQPVVTQGYQLRKGIPVRFAVRFPDEVPGRPTLYVSMLQRRGESFSQGTAELEASGKGAVTLPELDGSYQLNCADLTGQYLANRVIEVVFESGFDPRRVQPTVTRQEDGINIVRDANGATATLRGCDAVIQDGALVIEIAVEASYPGNTAPRLEGRVVDVDSVGIEGAAVGLSFHTGSTAMASDTTIRTDDKGFFSVRIPRLQNGTKVGLSIHRDGYAAMDTRPIAISDAAGHRENVGTITLGTGSVIRIRVVNQDGSRVQGVFVEPGNGFAARSRSANTDSDGECLLSGLAPGRLNLSARSGELMARTTINLNEGMNETITLKLAPLKTPSPTTTKIEKPALPVGSKAPEWRIAEWTDGDKRKLSDYRGKVVVLEFWGVWCGPCLDGIPMKKELMARYADRNVEFLGIHTAGTDMDTILRLLKQQDWNVTVGIDAGDEESGETVTRYDVQSFPTVLVIDGSGTITFNSGKVPEDPATVAEEMKRAAQVAGVAWPIGPDVSKGEAKERMMKVILELYGRAIDDAIGKAQ
jgi:thiol-disulfide isomerase/thioredoxin